MSTYDELNTILVDLFNHTMDIERRFVKESSFKDISVNDMHILEAIGPVRQQNMSAVASKVGVTVGTLTIAMNGLVRKGYVERQRSTEDKRVVLVSLSDKGKKAYACHAQFHLQIVGAMKKGLSEEDCQRLIESLEKLQKHLYEI